MSSTSSTSKGDSELMLTYFYDVINRSKLGMWVAAEDKVDAAVIAHDLKHTHEVENAQVEGPLPVKDAGLQALLDAGRRGHLGYEVPKTEIEDIITGGNRSYSIWFFIKEFPHE